jgi:hypothetical protein
MSMILAKVKEMTLRRLMTNITNDCQEDADTGFSWEMTIAEYICNLFDIKPKDQDPTDIQMHGVILNGEPHAQTLKEYSERGYQILKIDKAKKYHPYATETDTILFVAKPMDKLAYDKHMEEWQENREVVEGIVK